MVIPAHPLALTADRRLDERHQRALTRYYLASGAGGIAVAVHTTQFGIRGPGVGLHEPVLSLAAETARASAKPGTTPVIVAGVLGRTDQAVAEAALAHDLGYDFALLQLGALGAAEDDELVAHCERVAEVMPLFGFYLQPAVGGRRLSRDFWRRFAAIPNVAAIKVAPFDRYATIDVLLGVAASGRAHEIALYTGNDDAIVADLLFRFSTVGPDGSTLVLGFSGGLLGHWAVWTNKAVRLAGEHPWTRGHRTARPRRDPGVGIPDDRCQRRHLRSLASLRRLHPWHPRSAPATGADGRCLDARSG